MVNLHLLSRPLNISLSAQGKQACRDAGAVAAVTKALAESGSAAAKTDAQGALDKMA